VTIATGVVSRGAPRERPVADDLMVAARRLLWVAVLCTMTAPRIELGSVHFTLGDVLAELSAACWLASWALAPSRPMLVRAAFWPLAILGVSVVSAASSINMGATGVGLVELTILWVLPALLVPNLVSSPPRVRDFLTCVSAGSLIAAGMNIVEALRVGTVDGGLPQVWGAVQYFQGYFQVVGLIIAVSRLMNSVASKRPLSAFSWVIACMLNAIALLLTQTRGAWLAALAAMVVLGIAWRPVVLIGAIGVLSIGVLAFWGAGWTGIVGERVQSIFTLQAGLEGFESSIGRLALAVTAWQIFLAHPLLGVGLKNFPLAMPVYAPSGMPLAYEMGRDRVLTAVEGPHNTYLRLLSEIGVLGLVGLVGWQADSMRRFYQESRANRSVDHPFGTHPAVLLAAATVIAVYNFFFEMTQTGMLIFIAVLSLAYSTRSFQRVR